MKLLPVALSLQGRRVLIVGGGPVAARKAQSLLECGAHVVAVAPEFCPEFAPIFPKIEVHQRPFAPGDEAGAALLFACTNNAELNAALHRASREANILCSVADDGANSDFHSLAAFWRGEICVAIGTGGASPALSRHLKAKASAAIGPEYETLLEILATLRGELAQRMSQQSQRAAFWRAVLDGPVLELLRSGQRGAAENWIETELRNLNQK